MTFSSSTWKTCRRRIAQTWPDFKKISKKLPHSRVKNAVRAFPISDSVLKETMAEAHVRQT